MELYLVIITCHEASSKATEQRAELEASGGVFLQRDAAGTGSESKSMRTSGGDAGSVLFGTREQVGVGRGLAEFRAGRPVAIKGDGKTLLCLPVEGLDS